MRHHRGDNEKAHLFAEAAPPRMPRNCQASLQQSSQAGRPSPLLDLLCRKTRLSKLLKPPVEGEGLGGQISYPGGKVHFK